MRLYRYLKTYRIEDPAVRREKSTFLGIIHAIVPTSNSASDQKTRHTADLVVGILLLLAIMRVHQVHRPSQDSAVLSPHGLRRLYLGHPPLPRCPDQVV